jgi:UDP-N-acetylglucosamine 2-epimerase (non-hydrolysing)
MVAAPLSGVLALTSTAPDSKAAALALSVTRSAIVRLAPVAAALAELGVTQAGWAPHGRPPRTLSLAPAPEQIAHELDERRPSVVLCAGDGDAVVTAARLSSARGLPIARIGAGLRSGDFTDPLELNRIVLDELADVLFVDGEGAAETLRDEGFPAAAIACVGSTIPDAVLRWRATAERRRVAAGFGLERGEYMLAALSRSPSDAVVDGLAAVARRRALVVCAAAHDHAALERAGGAIVVGPLDYVDFLALEASAAAVLTDSSAVQEETTVLGVPCFTLAAGSERTLTLTHGTNTLLGEDAADIALVDPGPVEVAPIAHWDGAAGRRIAAWLVGDA